MDFGADATNMFIMTTKAGQQLKERRERKGDSPEAAGKKIGCSHTHVRRLEAGETMPAVDLAARIETAYGVRIRLWAQKESP